jgi:hypothetical protein
MPKPGNEESKRKPLKPKPRPEADRAAVRLGIGRRFAVSLEYLAR